MRFVDPAKVGYKTCGHCGEVKHGSEFQMRTGTVDGLTGRCKECLRHEARERYERVEVEDAGPGDYWVYKIRDSQGVVLYVGRTKTGFRRIAEHKKGREWSREIATIEVEHFDGIVEADARERELIHELQPPYNTVWARYGKSDGHPGVSGVYALGTSNDAEPPTGSLRERQKDLHIS